MKKKALLVALSVLLLSAMAVPVLAQYSWTVGVKVGDWFLYKGTLISWSGTAPFPPAYIEFLGTYNTSDWMKYTVTAISVPTVTFSVLTHWKNGTETTSTVEDNMYSSSELMVIGANLPNGTEIRQAYSLLDMWDMPARYLNQPIMLATPNGTRETNVAIHQSNIFGNIFNYTYHWDKATGIQVYFRTSTENSLDQNGNTMNYDAKLELIDSSSGVLVPDLTGPVVLLTLMASTVPIVLHKRKRILI